MLYITITEPGDVIVVPAKEGSVDVQDSRYYIVKDGALTEVPWHEASEYQKPFQEKSDWMDKRRRTR